MVTTPAATPIAMPTALPADPPPVESGCEPSPPPPPESVLLNGLLPNGQKSPPFGGSTHVKESPSAMVWKSVCNVNASVVFVSRTKAAGAGTVSLVLQFGPRAPMKDVLPKMALFSIVKLWAEVMAMA